MIIVKDYQKSRQTNILTDDRILHEIKKIAEKYNPCKVVLFGSRARADNSPVSDYDIAVYGNNLTPGDKAWFYSEIDDIDTLKKIEVVFMEESFGDDFLESIKKEGVVIYEQVWKQIK